MGFTHRQVSRIEEDTKAWVAKNNAQVDTVNEGDPQFCMVDGIRANHKLAKFCEEIRKVNRYVKFGVAGRASWEWQNSMHVARELYVYMEGHAYALMRVGVGDYAVRASEGVKYMVAARMIKNDKFNADRDQYHMATAETIERGLKNVKKYMRPYSPVECADLSYGSIRSNFGNIGYQTSVDVDNAKAFVTNSPHIRMELFHMLDLGYEFLSEEFRNLIAVWREKHNEDQITRGRVLHVYYAAVRIHRDEMVCDVIEVLDAHKHYTIDKNATVVTYKMEDLPEHIAGSLAALSMVGDDHYVDGVGLRVDGSTFWVQR